MFKIYNYFKCGDLYKFENIANKYKSRIHVLNTVSTLYELVCVRCVLTISKVMRNSAYVMLQFDSIKGFF